MELKDIKVGERYRWAAVCDVTVKSVEVDNHGDIAVMRHATAGDAWGTAHPGDLSPIVRRYTVELRPPKAGESYLTTDKKFATAGDDWTSPQWVIVDGDQ